MTKLTTIYPWQVQQWQRYLKARSADHLPHALLITGSDGIGKDDFAHLLANSLLCEQIDAQGYACGECQSCRVRKSGAHPDYKVVELPEGKQQIPVNAIRELTDFLSLSRSYGGYRVVIISPADKMNVNAANSLLKSLEEPPSTTMILLVASRMSRLPATIRSRCQVFAMPKPERAASLAWLEQQSLEGAADKLLALADDKPLLAKKLDKEEELVADRNRFGKDLMALLGQRRSVTSVAKDWEKFDAETLLNWQLKWVQATIKMCALPHDEGVTSNKFLQQIATFSNDLDGLYKIHTSLLDLKSKTEYPLNRLMFMESMLLLWREYRQPQ